MYAAQTRKRKFSEQVVPRISDPPVLSRRHSSENARAGNPFDDVNYPIPDFQRVYGLMRSPVTGLQLADRRWRLLTYSKCFIGTHAVQWMVDTLSLPREAAVATGQRLMDAGIIHHVTHSEPFADQYYFYRFQEDDDTNILNMKRVWDSAIPTRHPVDVSKELLTRLALLCEEHRKRVLAAKTPPAQSPSLAQSPVLGQNPPDVSNSGSSLASVLPRPAASLLASPVGPGLSQGLTRSLSAPHGMLGKKLLTPPHPRPTTPLLQLTAPSPGQAPAQNQTVGDDVDFSVLAKSEDFRQYTLAAAELQRVELVALNNDERTAFFVNCYNALCLHGYVTHGPPTNVLRRWMFFRALSYRIAGLDMTLDDLEHGILRGNKRPPMIKFLQQLRPSDPKCQHVLKQREERIHFVISAGTRSDPPIRILDGENVQEELHDATVEFLSYSVKVDVEKRAVTLPRIFLWYAEDFPTPEKSLLQWVARYLPVESSHNLLSLVSRPESSPTVSYENFDWSNAEARFNASVVRRKRRKLERERSSSGTICVDRESMDVSYGGLSPFFAGNLFAVGGSPGDHKNAIIPRIPASSAKGEEAARSIAALFTPSPQEDALSAQAVNSEPRAMGANARTTQGRDVARHKDKHVG